MHSKEYNHLKVFHLLRIQQTIKISKEKKDPTNIFMKTIILIKIQNLDQRKVMINGRINQINKK